MWELWETQISVFNFTRNSNKSNSIELLSAGPGRPSGDCSAVLVSLLYSDCYHSASSHRWSESAWSTLIGRAMSRLVSHWSICLPLAGSLCHEDSWLPCTERSYYRRPYAIKNQRGASKIPPNGGILRSKAPSRGLWMPELVLYGIRELAKQFLGAILDIEVDNSALVT